MCKYVLLGLLLLLVVLMVVAVLVVQEYGWVGFLVFLGALAVLGFLAMKAMPRLFMYMLMRPLKKMGKVLHGARLSVHSVIPSEPPDDEDDEDDREDWQAIEDDDDRYRDSDDEAEDDRDFQEQFGPFDWYEIEFTITPAGDPSSEGRIVHRPSWSPAFISAVGRKPPLAQANPFRGWPPPDTFSDTVQNAPAEVWTDTDWDAEVNQVYGQQRMRMRVGVTRTVREVTIVYAQFTELGVVRLPIVDVRFGGDG